MTTKKNILLSLVFLVMSVCVYAQDNTDGKYIEHIVKWYEDLPTISAKYGVPEDVIVSVNKLQSKTLRTRQRLLIPTDEKQWTDLTAKEEENVVTADDGTESPVQANGMTTINRGTDMQHSDTVKFALLMPLLNDNANNMDFYSGALMAAKQAGDEGIDVVMNVIDYNHWDGNIYGNDFVIGPVRYEDIETALTAVQDSISFLSPLDPKAAKLCESDKRLIQAAASSAEQYAEAARWAREIGREHGAKRYIIVGGENDAASLNAATDAFVKEGLGYSVCMTGVQGDIRNWDKYALKAGTGHNIVLLAIANEAVLNNAIRNISICASEGNITVLTGNKIRSYETIPEENIHKAEVHAVCPYYVDYTDEQTLAFIHKYRSLFNNEPSQFSYQGYDLVYYAIKHFSENGYEWMEKAAKSGQSCDMLQASFRFQRNENGAFVNNGMRRIIYHQDFSISLEKKN